MTVAGWYTDEETEAFMRSMVLPEEDRRRYTTAPWQGGYRWFRSANVVCLEHYRRRRRENPPTPPRDGDKAA
jgi:hypothetical protein